MPRRNVVRALAIIVIASFALLRPARAEEFVSAAQNPCLKYLPKDWSLVVNVNVKGWFEWVHQEFKDQPQEQMAEAYRQQLRLLTGMDPDGEVDYVTVMVSGDLEANPGVVAVVRGTFANAAVTRALTGGAFGLGAQRVQTRGGPVTQSAGMAYYFPERGTLVIGEPKQVLAVANAAAGDLGAISDPMKKTLESTRADSLLWLLGQPKAILETAALADWRKENAGLVDHLRKIDYFSMFFQTNDDGLRINLLTNLGSAASAGRFNDYLKERRSALINREGSNIFGFFALDVSEVKSTDNQVTVTLPLTGAALEKAWNSTVIAKPKAGAANDR